MKSILFLTTLLASSIVSAGTFYKVESLWTNTSPSNTYLPGDVIYCTRVVDSERNIVGGCMNLNWMKNNSVLVDGNGAVKLTQSKPLQVSVVGKVKVNSKQFILDEIAAAGYLKEVSMNSNLETNILVRKTLKLNDSIGCDGIFDCDWRVIYSQNKVSFEVKFEGKRLEKVKLN